MTGFKSNMLMFEPIDLNTTFSRLGTNEEKTTESVLQELTFIQSSYEKLSIVVD